MPYSTVDTILKRGVNKANISSIIGIWKTLGIRVEALGEKLQSLAAHKEGIDWTLEKLEDIENYKKYVLRKRTKIRNNTLRREYYELWRTD